MPTVLALDVSLSMCRPIKELGNGDEYSRKSLAIHGLSTLLNHFTANCRLEFTSLVVFSYLWEQMVQFTRDVELIKQALITVGDYSKTCLEPVLSALNGLVLEEFGGTTPVQVILVTDGSPGVGPGSLKNLLQAWKKSAEGDSQTVCPLPFQFRGKLNIVCLANPTDPELKKSLPLYQQLIEMNNGAGEVFVPDGPLTLASVSEMFTKITQKYYSSYKGLLTCGRLKCHITLFPSPEPYNKVSDFENVRSTVSDVLEICGFMDVQDIASPPTVSRHLVLPVAGKQRQINTATADTAGDGVKDEEEELDDGRTPSFTVLLHGSLKVESMVAITKVSEDWYGILYSWADSKKKSSLMLSLFQPGLDAVSWLGNLSYLSPISDFSESPYGDDDNRTPFPVRPKEKRSYAQSCVVWIKAVGLQADLQKIIRHARKLPEKQQQFYKELNRVRKALLSFGFIELLEAIAGMLERECTMLPGSAHPDAAIQLTHAASKLCSDMAKDASQLIVPLPTNFTQDNG